MAGLFGSIITVGIDSIKKTTTKAVDATLNAAETIQVKAQELEEERDAEKEFLLKAFKREYGFDCESDPDSDSLSYWARTSNDYTADIILRSKLFSIDLLVDYIREYKGEEVSHSSVRQFIKRERLKFKKGV